MVCVNATVVVCISATRDDTKNSKTSDEVMYTYDNTILHNYNIGKRAGN